MLEKGKHFKVKNLQLWWHNWRCAVTMRETETMWNNVHSFKIESVYQIKTVEVSNSRTEFSRRSRIPSSKYHTSWVTLTKTHLVNSRCKAARRVRQRSASEAEFRSRHSESNRSLRSRSTSRWSSSRWNNQTNYKTNTEQTPSDLICI